MLGDDLACSIFTAAATAANRKLALHFEQGARTVVNGIADLAITHRVTDANVHLSPSFQPPQRLFMG
jgi:hypothetical protein